MQFEVVDETKIVVEAPLVGITPNSVLNQLNRAFGLSGTLGRLRRQEVGSELICDHQMWIQIRRNLQQRRQQAVVPRQHVVLVSEILYGSGPVEIRQQSFIAQTESFHRFRRSDVKNFLQACASAHAVNLHKRENRGTQKEGQEDAREECSSPARTHFKFRCSKIRTAPLKAIAA